MPELLTREERVRLQSEIQGVTQQRMLREMTQAQCADPERAVGTIGTAKPGQVRLERVHAARRAYERHPNGVL